MALVTNMGLGLDWGKGKTDRRSIGNQSRENDKLDVNERRNANKA